MTNTMISSGSETQVSQDAISERARTLWLERGQPSGQDEAIWLQAERELREQAAASSALAVSIPAPTATPAVPPSAMAQERVETSPVKPAARKRGGKGR
jgi:hypothetical protein